MNTTYIKQYGAKRTGTNYLRWLLEANFKNVSVLTNILGWKHGLHSRDVDWSGHDWDHRRPESSAKLVAMVTPDLKKSYEDGLIRYAILVKNPYSYYVSNARQWPSPKGDSEYACDLVTTWNVCYADWLKLSESAKYALVVRFEDLIGKKKSCLNAMADAFGLHEIKNLVDTQKSLRALNETTKNQKQFVRKKSFDIEFYTKKKYMSFISKEVLRAINDTVDMELMRKFDYVVEGR